MERNYGEEILALIFTVAVGIAVLFAITAPVVVVIATTSCKQETVYTPNSEVPYATPVE